jgi:hypothetical protein
MEMMRMLKKKQNSDRRTSWQKFLMSTVRLRGMGTGISEASKRVPIFSFATQPGGKQVSSYFRQGNSDKDTIKVYSFCLSKTHR